MEGIATRWSLEGIDRFRWWITFGDEQSYDLFGLHPDEGNIFTEVCSIRAIVTRRGNVARTEKSGLRLLLVPFSDGGFLACYWRLWSGTIPQCHGVD